MTLELFCSLHSDILVQPVSLSLEKTPEHYTPKLHAGYEAHRSGGLRINLRHRAIFNAHRHLNARAFLLFALIKKASTVAGIKPLSSGSMRGKLMSEKKGVREKSYVC